MGMHNYGFLLDENVVKLKSLFPRNRAKTVHDYKLDGEPDSKVIKVAGDEGLIIVTADAQYPEFFRKIAHSGGSKQHLYGLVLIVPTDLERQKRLFPLNEIENRLRLNEVKNISWPIVSGYNLLVRVEEGRRVTVQRLPPCPAKTDPSEFSQTNTLGE